jgi:hypothetical protein
MRISPCPPALLASARSSAAAPTTTPTSPAASPASASTPASRLSSASSPDTIEQAIERAGAKSGNKGADAALWLSRSEKREQARAAEPPADHANPFDTPVSQTTLIVNSKAESRIPPMHDPTWQWQSGAAESVQIGSVNPNAHRRRGHRAIKGTDHGQYAYKVECLHCAYVYGANGSDVHLRNCPKCQNSRRGFRAGASALCSPKLDR